MEPIKKIAIFDPELVELLKEQGRQWGASPDGFMASVRSIVEQHYRDATALPPAEDDDRDLYLLVGRDIAIVFVVDESHLVIRGVGKPTAYGTIVGDQLVIPGRKKPVH